MNSNSTIYKNFKILGKQKALVALIVLFIVMALASPNFLTWDNLTDLLYQTVTYAIIGLGVTLTIVAAACDLSIGGVMCLSGIITIGLQPYMPVWCAILIAVAIGAVIGFVNGFFSVHQKTEPFIITLGMGILLRGLNLQLTNATTIAGTDQAFMEFGTATVLGIPYAVIIAVVLIAFFHFLMTRTSYGRNLYAIGGDYEVAVYSGIKALKLKWIAFIISGVTAAIGGILLSARLNAASATFGETTGYVINCSVVIGGTSFAGGVGGILPSVVGIFLLQVIENSMNLLAISPYIQKLVEGLIIVLIIGMDLFAIKRRREKV
jgi:ribose transport system permease protein